MDELNNDMLMGLPEFRRLMHLSPSSERRMRTSEEDWAPHLVVGRKVFYRRSAVMEWLERQEAKQVGVR